MNIVNTWSACCRGCTLRKATSRTVLGAFSSVGVVNVSIKEPGNVKRKKVVGATKREARGDKLSTPNVNTGTHYMHFIIEILNIMESFSDMQEFHVVIDNASTIHVPDLTNPLIKKRSYILLYLPPCLSKLNPIEYFWSKVNRHALKDTITLTTRIVNSCEELRFSIFKTVFKIQ